MHNTVILNVVGLSGRLLGEHTPNLLKLAQTGSRHRLTTTTPAVTCSVQASIMTGLLPREHGVVGNGWYFRELAEVSLWRQAASLYSGERIWEAAKRQDSSFTSAKMFWWYNMYDSADYAVTPRPMYPADGRKLPDIWSWPLEMRQELNQKLGTFPLFNFWGPKANIRCSEWIAAASKHVFDTKKPTLTLIYLPHLDYCLQKHGVSSPLIAAELRAIDAVCGDLIEHFSRQQAKILVLSEYAITDVAGPVHINRVLREAGLLSVREELGRELLDAGASDAFAVADHQIAHVYVKQKDRISEVKQLLARQAHIELVLDQDGKAQLGLDHPRSGDLVALSDSQHWFTYYYWQDDDRAPDFARTVDIHRKPGYDPVELFLDPKKPFLPLRIAATLAKKKLGFRSLLDVIPLDATLVKGSHGRVHDTDSDSPILLSSTPLATARSYHVCELKHLVLSQIFGEQT